MKLRFFTAITIVITFIQCKQENNKFLLSEGKVGLLTKETTLAQLDSVYAGDSIVKLQAQNYLNSSSQIEIYEKGGSKLLELSIRENATPAINNIRIFDGRYKTHKGLHLNSTFKDVKENYTISNIQNGLQTLVVSLVDSDIYITIDKVYLTEELRNQPGATITQNDIPDTATFKFFMIDWNE